MTDDRETALLVEQLRLDIEARKRQQDVAASGGVTTPAVDDAEQAVDPDAGTAAVDNPESLPITADVHDSPESETSQSDAVLIAAEAAEGAALMRAEAAVSPESADTGDARTDEGHTSVSMPDSPELQHNTGPVVAPNETIGCIEDREVSITDTAPGDPTGDGGDTRPPKAPSTPARKPRLQRARGALERAVAKNTPPPGWPRALQLIRRNQGAVNESLVRVADALLETLEWTREKVIGLESQIAAQNARSDRHAADLAGLSRRLDERHAQIVQILEERNRELAVERMRIDAAERRLDEHRRELDEHRRELDEHRRELDEHRRELDEHRRRLGEHDHDLGQHRERLESHDRSIWQHDRSGDELRGAFSDLTRRVDLQARQTTEDEQRLDFQRQQLASLETAFEAAYRDTLHSLQEHRRDVLDLTAAKRKKPAGRRRRATGKKSVPETKDG